MNPIFDVQRHYEKVKDFFSNCVEFITDPNQVEEELKFYANKPLKNIVFDSETTGLDAWAGETYLHHHQDGSIVKIEDGAIPFSIQLGILDFVENKLKCYFVLLENKNKSKQYVKSLLENPFIMKIGHELKFDIKMAKKIDINVKGKLWDTQLASRLLFDRLPKHSLKYLGTYFSGESQIESNKPWDIELKSWLRQKRNNLTRQGFPKNYVNYSFVPLSIMYPYGLNDVWYTYLLYILFNPIIEKNYKELFKRECKLIRIAYRMEKRGTKIDKKLCIKTLPQIEIEKLKLIKKIRHYLKFYHPKIKKFNIQSPAQLKNVLLEIGLTKEDLTYRGKLSVDYDSVIRLFHKYDKKFNLLFCKDVLNYRTLTKISKTYFKKLITISNEKGIVHCNMRVSDTKNGRLACNDPNLQNLPRPETIEFENVAKVREVFIPRKDFINWYYDYSQIEMLIFALFCQERTMLKAIAQNEDLHLTVAKLIFGQNAKEHRQETKNLNFGIIYGMGLDTLADKLNTTRDKACDLMYRYKNKFNEVSNLQFKIKKLLYTNGFIVDIFNRLYHIPIEKAYTGVNALVQGCSANVLKHAIIQVDKFIKYFSKEKLINLLLSVHDELIIEIHKSIPIWIPYVIKLIMEEILQLIQYEIKVNVDIKYSNTSWATKLPVKFNTYWIALANNYFMSSKSNFLLPIIKPKINWFLKDIK